jgi:hypothetical protein
MEAYRTAGGKYAGAIYLLGAPAMEWQDLKDVVSVLEPDGMLRRLDTFGAGRGLNVCTVEAEEVVQAILDVAAANATGASGASEEEGTGLAASDLGDDGLFSLPSSPTQAEDSSGLLTAAIRQRRASTMKLEESAVKIQASIRGMSARSSGKKSGWGKLRQDVDVVTHVRASLTEPLGVQINFVALGIQIESIKESSSIGELLNKGDILKRINGREVFAKDHRQVVQMMKDNLVLELTVLRYKEGGGSSTADLLSQEATKRRQKREDEGGGEKSSATAGVSILSLAQNPAAASPKVAETKPVWKPDEIKLTIVSSKDLKSGDWFSANDVFVTVVQDGGTDELVAKTEVRKEEDHVATINQTFTLAKPSGSLTFTVLDRDTVLDRADDPVGMVRFSLDKALEEPGAHQFELVLQGGKVFDQAEGMAFKNNKHVQGHGTLTIIVEGVKTAPKGSGEE